MTEIPGRHEHHISGLTDYDCAHLLGNINADGVHETSPYDWICTVETGLSHACSIYWVFHTNSRFNLRKTNTAMRCWLADCSTDMESLEAKARPVHPYSNSFCNKMVCSLAGRNTNQIYCSRG